MTITTENLGLAQICAQAFSTVNDRRKAGIAKFLSQGYKMVMTHNGYVDNVKNTLWVTNDGWNYCDDNLGVGDKCALVQSSDFSRWLDIEISAVNNLSWCDRVEYSFTHLAAREVGYE